MFNRNLFSDTHVYFVVINEMMYYVVCIKTDKTIF